MAIGRLHKEFFCKLKTHVNIRDLLIKSAIDKFKELYTVFLNQPDLEKVFWESWSKIYINCLLLTFETRYNIDIRIFM